MFESYYMYADCLLKFSVFFAHIKSQLDQISNPDGDIDDEDAVLKILYSRLKGQAQEVIGACSKFNSYCSRVEIAVEVLDQFKPDGTTEFMADWIKKANAAVQERTAE